MADFCDVRTCPNGGSHDGPFGGYLCSRHYDRFQKAVRDNAVFPAEIFIGLKTLQEDEAAAQDAYSRWLASQEGLR